MRRRNCCGCCHCHFSLHLVLHRKLGKLLRKQQARHGADRGRTVGLAGLLVLQRGDVVRIGVRGYRSSDNGNKTHGRLRDVSWDHKLRDPDRCSCSNAQMRLCVEFRADSARPFGFSIVIITYFLRLCKYELSRDHFQVLEPNGLRELKCAADLPAISAVSDLAGMRASAGAPSHTDSVAADAVGSLR